MAAGALERIARGRQDKFCASAMPMANETIKQLRRWKTMDASFTSADLRLAARQAMTLAFMDFRRDTCETLLKTADRLLAEADDLEKLIFRPSQSDQDARIVNLMEALQNRARK